MIAPEFIKLFGDYGLMTVMAGVTLYNYFVAVKANMQNLEKITRLIDSNGRLLEELARSNMNTSESLDIIKSMLSDNSRTTDVIAGNVETVLDKVMCIKEKSGFSSSFERERETRKAKNGTK